MTSKTTRIGLLFLISCVLAVVTVLTSSVAPDSLASVSMLNVGQGDSFLIEAPNGAQMLVDGGRDATELSELSKLMKWNDKKIDVVVATHPDADHIAGLVDVVKRYDVGLFLTSDVYSDTQTYKSLLEAVAEKKIPSYFVRAGMKLDLDQVNKESFTVLFPDRDTHDWETNSASVVGRLDIGDRSALFTGDSPIAIERYLVQKDPKVLDVDILKLGHHGSKTSSSVEFLKATSPSLALISAGVNNSYGHPHKEVLDRLQTLAIPWVSTQESGTVVFETDGTQWWRK